MTAATVSTTGAVVTFRTDRMPNSTELKRLLRAVDGLYYAELFSGEAPYAGRKDVWRSWVAFGFGTGLQQGPPGVEDDDRIRVSTFSDGKELTFTVSGGNPQAFGRWVTLLQDVDSARAELAVVANGERVDALAARVAVVADLNRAVAEGLADSDAEDRTRVEAAIRTSLGALTFPIVTGCRITTITTTSSTTTTTTTPA